MSAFNFILVEGNCPSCGQRVTIEAQTHIASSFSGDDSGRFCGRNYRLGEKMAWWQVSDPRYPLWREDTSWVAPEIRAKEALSDEAVECCYARCTSCNVEDLFALISFRQTRPVEVLQIGWETDWVDGHYR